MTFDLMRRYRFEAAHRLPMVPTDHRCARMHGHTYTVNILLRGQLDADAGWVTDYAAIDGFVQPLIAELDHRCLNDVKGLDNPTSELLTVWLWQRLKPALPALSEITVAENPDSACSYRGEGL